MTATTPVPAGPLAGLTDEPIPQEVRDTVCGFSLLLGPANVVMQLSRLPVGHGVAKSRVESGRADRHPLKRLRTTSAYLVIATLGTAQERLALRAEIARSHGQVHSEPGDEVAYNAFDPELQLWVAACLHVGAIDVFTRLWGAPTPEQRAVLHHHGRRLGTTLQVREDMWPATPAAFDDYWRAGLEQVRMDDVTRTYLHDLVETRFTTNVFRGPVAPVGEALSASSAFTTLGFLPEPFRGELGLPWSAADQRRHDAIFGAVVAVSRRLPRVVREFPLNAYGWDTRRRLRTGRPVV